MSVTINEAVRTLRKHVGKTQQIFATELGMSISALNNYERTRIPEPKQLLTFHRAAVEAGRHDLAHVFRTELISALGLMSAWAWLFQSGGTVGERVLDQPRDEFEQEAVKAVLWCLRGQDKPSVSRLVHAICGAIRDPERAQRFEEEAARRGIIPTTKTKRRKK